MTSHSDTLVIWTSSLVEEREAVEDTNMAQEEVFLRISRRKPRVSPRETSCKTFLDEKHKL